MSQKQIYGLIGYPVQHSLSAAMHNAAFKELEIPAEYKLFPLQEKELEDFLKNLGSKNIYGLNVTIPYKVKIFERARLLAGITIREHPYIFLSGAVNTVKREGSKLHYYNTDIEGFSRSLRESPKNWGLGFDTRDKTAMVFGCGGAGRAVITGLLQEGMGIKKIYAYDINKDMTVSTQKHFLNIDLPLNITDRLEFITDNEISEKIKICDLLVNASPIGMKEADGSIIDKNWLHPKLSVYDVVYNRQTQLIKDAKSRGLNAVGGLGMFLYQGTAAFKIWTGEDAPVEVMRQVLKEAMVTKPPTNNGHIG